MIRRLIAGVAAAVAIVSAPAANAVTYFSSRVEYVEIVNQGYAMIAFETGIPGPAPCGGYGAHETFVTLGDEAGRALVAAAITARTTGATVGVAVTDDCVFDTRKLFVMYFG